MKTKNSIGLAIMLLMLTGIAFGQTGPAAGTPKLVIKSTEHNLGEVKKGTPAAYSYVFKNEGTADLEIKRVAPTCGCTATDFTKIIPPGKEGKITLSVGTDAYNGAVSKNAEVYTNDPQKEQFTLVISFVVLSDMTPNGKIVGPFIVGPSNQWSTHTAQGFAANGLVTVTNNTAQPIKITKMIPGGEAIYVKLVTNEEGKRYSLEVLSAAGLPVGNHVQTVKLLTDSKEMPELAVDLQVVVFPAVTVNPTNLVFDRVAVSQPDADVTYLSKFVWLKMGRGDGLEIKSMTSDLPFIKAKVESTNGNGQTIVLRIGFSEKPSVGTHKGKLRIETNNSAAKEVEIPITVTAN